MLIQGELELMEKNSSAKSGKEAAREIILVCQEKILKKDIDIKLTVHYFTFHCLSNMAYLPITLLYWLSLNVVIIYVMSRSKCKTRNYITLIPDLIIIYLHTTQLSDLLGRRLCSSLQLDSEVVII